MITRQSIVDTLITTLETIPEITTVYEWFTSDLMTEDMPSVIIKDVKEDVIERFIGSVYKQLSIEIILIVSNGLNTSKDLRNISSILLQSLKPLNLTIQINSCELSFESAEELQGGALINLTVEYESDEFTI